MAEGLLSGVLPAIYSGSNVFKRKLVDALRDPGGTLANMAGNAYDGVMRLGKMTEEAGKEGMEFGPASKRLAMAIADGYNPGGITVWHGSPHKFTRFDSSKIGTGEGAQAYGHGLYVAESPEVAKQYAKELSAKVDVNGKPLLQANKIVGSTGNTDLDDYLVANLGDVKAARRNLLEDIRDVRPTNKDAAKDIQRTLAELRKVRVSASTDGNVYKVDLPDEHVARMLDWDKPLSQQAPDVLKVLPTVRNGYGDVMPLDASVSDYINAIKSRRNFGSDRGGTDAMREAGITGIRYLDGTSRTATPPRIESGPNGFTVYWGNDPKPVDTFKTMAEAQDAARQLDTRTSNFVVFPGNEDMLQILEVNGQPIIDALRKKR